MNNNKITNENINESFNSFHNNIHGNYFEIIYSKYGTAMIYINGRKSSINASGCGYDKNGVVISQLVNIVLNKTVIRDGSCGVSAFEDILTANNLKLTYVCETKEGHIYRLTYINNIADVA